ncbi:MAG: hypothetical protein K1X39_06190 [Thermoflexales bacterium]|nr:hypothetical protein [Thermoflexales bacterium]
MPTFYGRNVNTLRMFGQARYGDCAAGRVSGDKVYHAAGVVVDRRRNPHPVYVADTGNSRILGFRSWDSPSPDVVFGQPDLTSMAANGDCNLGMYGPTSAAQLCLMAFPAGTNVAEQWMYLNFGVDSYGNIYVPDIYNNRVVAYRNPFTPNAGPPVAVRVWGQADMAANGVNQGRGPGKPDERSLFLSMDPSAYASARGLCLDGADNLWVADTLNHRVLRFPRGSTTADLVLGQPDFTTCDVAAEHAQQAAPDRMRAPSSVQVDADGTVYVLDEHNGFFGRLLVFKGPLRNGMPARVIFPKQRLTGDFANGYTWAYPAGITLNPIKTDDFTDDTRTRRYRDGVLWTHDRNVGGHRILLLDGEGEILVAVGATDTVSAGFTDQLFWRGSLSPESGFNVTMTGGSIGFDSQHAMYLADGARHRIARYALPWRPRQTERGLSIPGDAGGKFPGTRPNGTGPANLAADDVGVVARGGQLIVRDFQRYLVWNDYLNKPDGAPADLFVGQTDGNTLSQRNLLTSRTMHGIDAANRLWATGEHNRLMVYQLPFTAASAPLRTLIPLFWADNPAEEVRYECHIALAIDPLLGHLWVSDSINHRLLRVRNPQDWAGKLIVDAVLGQPDKVQTQLNRGQPKPNAASFGAVNCLRFDRAGNLFVVDNTYEGHPNGRVIAFLHDDLAAINTLFPPTQAKRVYCVDGFEATQILRIHAPFDHPHSPVSVAFNSRGEMVIGNDGYYRDPRPRALRQLFLYRRPLEKQTPDAMIELPLGAPGELTFDEQDNLIVQDHTWNKVWVINYDRDPGWLRALPN